MYAATRHQRELNGRPNVSVSFFHSLEGGRVNLCWPGVAVNGQQVLEMAASGHPNSVIVGDVVLSMTSLRSDVTRYVRLNIAIFHIRTVCCLFQYFGFNVATTKSCFAPFPVL